MASFHIFSQEYLVKYSCFGGSDGKVSVCSAGDLGWIPGSGRSPGKGNGYLLQYSCLESSMDRGAVFILDMKGFLSPQLHYTPFS